MIITTREKAATPKTPLTMMRTVMPSISRDRSEIDGAWRGHLFDGDDNYDAAEEELNGDFNNEGHDNAAAMITLCSNKIKRVLGVQKKKDTSKGVSSSESRRIIGERRRICPRRGGAAV